MRHLLPRRDRADPRPVYEHLLFAHGRASDLDATDVQEQIEAEDLLEQLRRERGLVLRWVRSLRAWAATANYGAGSAAWAVGRWRRDYCAQASD